MPLTWGADYYLVGSFNGWADGITFDNGSYKFNYDNGTYTLTKDIPADALFKIVKVEGNIITAWYGTWGGTFEFNRDSQHYDTMYGGDGNNFKLPGVATGPATFTFQEGQKVQNDVTYVVPCNLTVTRDPQLYIRGFGDWNTNEAMTKTSTDGWTISKNLSRTNEEACKFNFKDEYGMQHGWNGDNDYTVNSGLLGTTITVSANVEKVFYMDATVPEGNYIIEVNSALDEMVIYENKSLAEIQNNGYSNSTYFIANDLQVVFINGDKHKAFARDLTGTTVSCPQGYVDYITTVAEEHTGDWNLYNWVMLDFTNAATSEFTKLSPNCVIKGGTLKGVYKNNWNNYAIQVSNDFKYEAGTAVADFVPNVYCPANFGPNTAHEQGGCYQETNFKVVNGASEAIGENEDAIKYWFITPKPMEVFELSGALYYYSNDFNEGFYMEKQMSTTTASGKVKWFNPAGLQGGISLNKSNNSTTSPNLTKGQSYRFLTMSWFKEPEPQNAPSYGAPLRDDFTYSLEPQSGSTLNPNVQAGALNLTGGNDQIVTGVSEVKSGSEVVSVTYCDLAGRMSQKPFAGVNIIVTRYSDGSTTTQKVIR